MKACPTCGKRRRPVPGAGAAVFCGDACRKAWRMAERAGFRRYALERALQLPRNGTVTVAGRTWTRAQVIRAVQSGGRDAEAWEKHLIRELTESRKRQASSLPGQARA